MAFALSAMGDYLRELSVASELGDVRNLSPRRFQFQGMPCDGALTKPKCALSGLVLRAMTCEICGFLTYRLHAHGPGYYSRHAALTELMDIFLSKFDEGSPCQVLSLGAGFDTTWFKLKSQNRAPTRYFEIDFQEVHRIHQ